MKTGPVAPMVEPRPMRVLVVDDERNIRATLRMCLEGLGCEVRGGRHARRRARGPRAAPGRSGLPRPAAGHRERAGPAAPAARRGAHAGRGGDHRLRHLRHRGGGHAARGARLPPQALHPRADPPRRGETRAHQRAELAAGQPGGAAGASRCPRPRWRRPRRRCTRRSRRRPGGGLGRGGAAARGERHGQGRARAGAARPERAAPTALRHRQLPHACPSSCWPASCSATCAGPSPAR